MGARNLVSKETMRTFSVRPRWGADDFLADALFGGLGFLSLSGQDADLRKARKVAA